MSELSSVQMPLTKRLLRGLAFVAVQIGLSLVLLEIGARVFDPAGISYYPATATFMDTMIIEEPIGYRNRPGLSGRYYGHALKVNSLGLRHRELELAPNPDVYRILLVGDSVLFGVGAADDETLPIQLESILQERIGRIDNREIEVISMGVISYNTEQELVQYQQLGSKLGADLVVLRFSPNDIEPKMWIFSKRSNALVNFGQRSYAISLLFKIKQLLSTQLLNADLIQRTSYAEGNPRWEAIDSSLTEFARLTREAGIPFIVTVRSDRGRETEMVRATGKREGFPVVAASPFQDDRWNHLEVTDFYAPASGGHLGAIGLGYTATLLFERLEALGLFQPDILHEESPDSLNRAS